MNTKHIILGVVILVIVIFAAFILFNNGQANQSYSDVATAKNHSDIWKTSNSIISRESKGTLFSRGEKNAWFYLYLNPSGTGSNYMHKTPFNITFDILNETYRTQIEFRDNKSVSNFEFNSIHKTRGVGHWEILVNDTSQKYYYNGDLVKTDNQTFSDNIRIGFVGIYKNNESESSLKFANFQMN